MQPFAKFSDGFETSVSIGLVLNFDTLVSYSKHTYTVEDIEERPSVCFGQGWFSFRVNHAHENIIFENIRFACRIFGDQICITAWHFAV